MALIAMVRAVKRELGGGASSSSSRRVEDDGEKGRRVLRSRYLAVKSKINGIFFFSFLFLGGKREI